MKTKEKEKRQKGRNSNTKPFDYLEGLDAFGFFFKHKAHARKI